MSTAARGGLSFKQTGDATLEIQIAGAWRLRGGLPSADLVQRQLESAPQVRQIAFEARELTSWDSSVLTFLVELSEDCRQCGINVDRGGLPAGVQRLLNLAEKWCRKKKARVKKPQKHHFSNGWAIAPSAPAPLSARC